MRKVEIHLEPQVADRLDRVMTRLRLLPVVVGHDNAVHAKLLESGIEEAEVMLGIRGNLTPTAVAVSRPVPSEVLRPATTPARTNGAPVWVEHTSPLTVREATKLSGLTYRAVQNAMYRGDLKQGPKTWSRRAGKRIATVLPKSLWSYMQRARVQNHYRNRARGAK